MSDPVRDIARAVLYEGYVLWPYRRSALKNQQRWTFGGTHPRPWSERQGGGDPWARHAEVLVAGADRARAAVELRFLQVVRRQAARVSGRRLEPVDELRSGDSRHLTWDEAAEREVAVGPVELAELVGEVRIPVAVAGGEDVETIGRDGALLRSWRPLRGELVLAATRLGDELWRLHARVENTSDFSVGSREEAMRHTLASTHLVIEVGEAQLVSATAPPPALAAEAAGCESDGLWPVLVGSEAARDRMLASPIILPDFPQVAPESGGDFFDGGEIDELLTLNVLGLTDSEREEMRATDPRTRAILERAEGLTREQLMRMHGTWR